MSLQYLERPAAGEPDGALVLFHGRGADEHDLFPLLDLLDPERRLAGFTPRGPLSLPRATPQATRFSGRASAALPPTLPAPGGAHWYVVREIGYPDARTFHASYAAAGDWLDGLGFAPERTVLGGFSQGAVMTYALGLGAGRRKPAALVALSGFVPTVDGWQADLSSPLPPVALGHGTFDPVIGVEWGRRARDLLTEAGGEIVYRESPMPHTIDPGFVDELRDFVARAVPARTPSPAQ